MEAAKIRLHVEAVQALELPDYDGESVESDLLILRVLRAYLDERVYDPEKNYVSHEALNALSRLGGPYFAEYKEIKDFKRSF